VVVHPGAAFPSRRWPVERFAAVARWAVGAGHPVVLTGGTAERPLTERVRRLAGLPPVADLAGRTTLRGLARVVARAAMVVCGDTGVAHLANAYATPSVLLFGPTPPARWGPPADGPHTVLWRPVVDGAVPAGDAAGDPVGDPWGDRLDPGLARIGVEEVLDACRDRLSVRPAPRPSTPRSA
jgi:ADP-heptose:LPS heptosyltransferase